MQSLCIHTVTGLGMKMSILGYISIRIGWLVAYFLHTREPIWTLVPKGVENVRNDHS